MSSPYNRWQLSLNTIGNTMAAIGTIYFVHQTVDPGNSSAYQNGTPGTNFFFQEHKVWGQRRPSKRNTKIMFIQRLVVPSLEENLRTKRQMIRAYWFTFITKHADAILANYKRHCQIPVTSHASQNFKANSPQNSQLSTLLFWAHEWWLQKLL